MRATQLAFSVVPMPTLQVGDRVRVLPSGVNPFLDFRAGDLGTVVEVRRPCGPGDLATWKPVCVMLDRWPDRRRFLAFEQDDLEVVAVAP